MHERRNKLTLEQIRTLFPFDVPAQAGRAGVSSETLYSALQMYPISKKDAENITSALSEHTGLALSSEQLEMVTWEDFLLLWVVRASSSAPGSSGSGEVRYHLLYARDQDHAALLAREWLGQLPHLPVCSFTACPEGFQIGEISLPGHQQREMDG